MEYQSAPIHTILKDGKYANAKKNLKEYTEELYKKGIECGKKNCSASGTCVSDPGFFQKPLAGGMPFSDIFRKGECICNQEKTGKTCDKKMDLKASVEASKKKRKTLAWTTIGIGSHDLKLYDFVGYKTDRLIKTFVNYNNDWLIFGNAFYDKPYATAVSRFGQKIIAVNKAEAVKAGVVYITTNFK